MTMFKLKPIDLQKLPISKMLVGILGVCLFFAVRGCHLKDLEISDNGLKIRMYQNNEQTFTTEKNELGETVVSQKEELIEYNKKHEKLLLEHTNLQKLHSQIKTTTETKIRNIMASYKLPANIHDTVFKTITTAGDTLDCIPVGTKFSKAEKWYSVGGEMLKTGIKFDSLSFRNELTISIGKKRKNGLAGYFQKKENTVQLFNENPYTNTLTMSNITFKEASPKWYQTKAAYFFGGFAAASFVIYQVRR